MDSFYKVEEVAKIFKVKPITIRKWCQLGLIQAKKFGKSWYIFKNDLENLLESESLKIDNTDSRKDKIEQQCKN